MYHSRAKMQGFFLRLKNIFFQLDSGLGTLLERLFA